MMPMLQFTGRGNQGVTVQGLSELLHQGGAGQEDAPPVKGNNNHHIRGMQC